MFTPLSPFDIDHSRNRVWKSPNLGYKSTLGITLWAAALIAFACAGQSIRYARDADPNYKTFQASYVNYLVAANVLAWLVFTICESSRSRCF